MGDKKRYGLTPEEWTQVRAGYESGTSIMSLHKRYGVSRMAIMNHRDTECWVAAPPPEHRPTVHERRTEHREIRERVRNNVVDFATGKALEQTDTVAIAASVATELVTTAETNRVLAEWALKIAKRGLAGKIRPAASPGEQTEADVFKAVASGVSLAQKMTRESHGLTTGMPTAASTDESDAPIGSVVKTVVARPTEEAKTA